jgi:hypothetical protein
MPPGSIVSFRLTPAGQVALSGLVPESGNFVAAVAFQDDRGVWVTEREVEGRGGRKKIMLLKWEHFSTAVFEVRLSRPKRPAVGFVR